MLPWLTPVMRIEREPRLYVALAIWLAGTTVGALITGWFAGSAWRWRGMNAAVVVAVTLVASGSGMEPGNDNDF